MLGVVLVAHGELAQTYMSVAEEMIGRQDYVKCVSYNIGDDMESVRESIARAIEAVDRQRGVVIVTDMFGGVPCNLSISVAQSWNVEVMSGMNLAMLLKLLTTRQVLSIKDAVQESKGVAKKYIYVLSEVLEELEEAS